MYKIHLYCDGGCRGNGKKEAIGGFGVVMYTADRKYRKEYKAAFPKTTNNQMELAAVIRGLTELKQPSEVTIYSDSAYVINAFNQNWITNWQVNGWRTSDNKPVKNKDLWETLLNLLSYHKVKFVKVRGHADNVDNNRCDELANEAMDELQGNS